MRISDWSSDVCSSDLWTLGRQTLLAPVTWSDDGWPRFGGGDLSHPIVKPLGGPRTPHGMPLSDDFSQDRFEPLCAFYDPAPDEQRRVTFCDHAMRTAGHGTTPAARSDTRRLWKKCVSKVV